MELAPLVELLGREVLKVLLGGRELRNLPDLSIVPASLSAVPNRNCVQPLPDLPLSLLAHISH